MVVVQVHVVFVYQLALIFKYRVLRIIRPEQYRPPGAEELDRTHIYGRMEQQLQALWYP